MVSREKTNDHRSGGGKKESGVGYPVATVSESSFGEIVRGIKKKRENGEWKRTCERRGGMFQTKGKT